MTKEEELQAILEMAKRIIQETGYIKTPNEVDIIINLMKNSPEVKHFLEK